MQDPSIAQEFADYATVPTFLGSPIFEADSVLNLVIRFLFNLFVGFVLVRLAYYPKARRKDWYVTFMLFSSTMFLLIFLMENVKLQIGMLSGYLIFCGVYNMKDSLWLLILPLCVSTMNVIILRTYIVSSIPAELMEAAKIDGAGEYRTFFQITLPLLKPSLAAVGFMMATAYWNDWQNAMMYIDTPEKQPLQMLLVNIQKNLDFLLNSQNVPADAISAMGGSIPQKSATMATVVVVIAPIMVVYPFFQKYFIKGLTVGSVKG